MTGYLPIHCVLQLMRSKTFRKHGVSVKDWIYRQLVSTVEPLHANLPSLIEEYVQAILVSPLSSASRHSKSHAAIVQVCVVTKLGLVTITFKKFFSIFVLLALV